ncbi:hypothetical protein ACQPTN_26395 [Bradyrhizobium sp. 13971]
MALELIAAAKPQVARDRQEPARNAFGVGQHIPEIGDVGVVAAGRDHRPRRLAVAFPEGDFANDGSDIGDRIDLHGWAPYQY